MAILFVTVLVEDADTAVPTIAVPVAAGSVMVFVPATAVGVSVIVPEVAPLSFKSPMLDHRPSAA